MIWKSVFISFKLKNIPAFRGIQEVNEISFLFSDEWGLIKPTPVSVLNWSRTHERVRSDLKMGLKQKHTHTVPPHVLRASFCYGSTSLCTFLKPGRTWTLASCVSLVRWRWTLGSRSPSPTSTTTSLAVTCTTPARPRTCPAAAWAREDHTLLFSSWTHCEDTKHSFSCTTCFWSGPAVTQRFLMSDLWNFITGVLSVKCV